MLSTPTVLLVCRSAHEGEERVRALEATGRVHCVGSVNARGEVVGACERRRPGVVLVDLRRKDGLEVVGDILRESPRPVVVLSASSERAAAAVAEGAVEALPADIGAEQAAESLVLMAAVRVIHRVGSPALAPTSTRLAVLAASTGGPGSLRAVLEQLPDDFSATVLLVQHMPDGFTPTFVEWLGHGLPLPVRAAVEGDGFQPGAVLVAPDHHHLVLSPGGRLALEPSRGGGPCPSADVLLHSVARASGLRTFGAVLTGMGRDGAAGLRALRAAGGTTLVQDEASSVVSGMPQAALEAGAATESLPPDAIGRRLAVWGGPAGHVEKRNEQDSHRR